MAEDKNKKGITKSKETFGSTIPKPKNTLKPKTNNNKKK